jgi:hypothetical protein
LSGAGILGQKHLLEACQIASGFKKLKLPPGMEAGIDAMTEE